MNRFPFFFLLFAIRAAQELIESRALLVADHWWSFISEDGFAAISCPCVRFSNNSAPALGDALPDVDGVQKKSIANAEDWNGELLTLFLALQVFVSVFPFDSSHDLVNELWGVLALH